jgi:two-component system, OmpR family, response regulator
VGKVLIVDDDEALRRLMRLELCDTHEVIDSGEPERGLALALEHRPDAILLDLRMPKYSGYELLQTFTSFSRTQMIPVIIVSGEAGGQTKEQCKQLGAAGYFEKPIDFDALRSCLQQMAKTRKYVPRTEVRVRLRVTLKLRGTDTQGKNFEQTATTENVSLSGFLCACAAELAANSIVDIYIVNVYATRGGEDYVGKAKIVHSDSKGAPLWHYGCRFVEKTGPWVLQ